jgi:HD-GYP domain-containing protein (c-di-GMP phosphodiesterase class II)
MEKELFKTLHKLNDIGLALSAEKDKSKLLQKIVEGAKELTYADGATLYTLTDQRQLQFEIIRTDSLNIHWQRQELQETLTKFPNIALYDKDGNPNDKTIAAYAVNHDKTINIEDAYFAEGFDFSGTKKFDELNKYRSKSFLTVPLKNHEGDIIGVLQLLNAKNGSNGKIIPFSQEDQKLVESLASQAAIAMTNQRLIKELREMFEALIRVMAEAIDEKSPITGKHCKRVPIIAQKIALAINDNQKGPLKEVKFSKDELYELDIAALLHDCGKVTTPVHVVEKGKKLETIFDRIDLINTRLEILKRDAKIKALEEKLKLNQDSKEFNAIDDNLSKEINKITQDQDILFSTNYGKEFISKEALDKIDELSNLYWIDSKSNQKPIITKDEADNLSISKGTLTDSERQVIQNHVVMTIKMLNQIPYPKYLKEVPEIAGKHHERIDGKGYPLGLKGDEMSLRARVLAVADIFEALTAPDRPYKDVMKLSQALSIMDKLSKEGHLDKDVWDVFMSEKVYLDYGKEYLKPDQLDVN